MSTATRIPIVALVGNPNAGKTSVFNGLTGLRQKVGNYPGVTVERASAQVKLGDRTVEFLDVPGIYSLNPESEDERIAVETLKGSPQPDLLVYVLDADNLERNLYLYSQIAGLGLPVIVALTMIDRVKGGGGEIDLEKLSRELGAPIVPLAAHREGVFSELKEVVSRCLVDPPAPPTLDLPGGPVELLRERLARVGADYSADDVARALVEENHPIRRMADEFPEIREALDASEEPSVEAHRLSPTNATPQQRYEWAGLVRKDALVGRRVKRKSDKIDAILTHRVFGLVIFVAIMVLVFQSIYTFAEPLMTLIEDGFAWLGDQVGGLLQGNEVLRSAIVDGLIGGVGGVVVFLPQILILFFFISVLEGTGYLARAAFLMDKLLGWCGLNGRAFIPLLSSFACAIPGVMAARVMPDPKSRLATILVAPLMSCSARLPVYVLLIGAFIEPKFGAFWAGVALFGMHLVGLFVAIPIVFILNRGMLKGRRLPFVLELPPYQWPKWRDVWLAMFHRGQVFLKTAGTIIVVMSLVIWGLTYFPRSEAADDAARTRFVQVNPDLAPDSDEAEMYVEEQRLANSFLGRFGKAIEPVFVPAGFDWRITTGILSAFPAREVVVPALGIIFSQGGDVDEESGDLRSALKKATWPDGRVLFTPWTAAGLMVFFALCCQCMATLAAVKRETNSWKWAWFQFGYMTTLAYLAAVFIHQVGILFGSR